MEVLLEGLDASIQTKQFLEQHVRQEHVSEVSLTLFRMGFFGAARGWGGLFGPPP